MQHSILVSKESIKRFKHFNYLSVSECGNIRSTNEDSVGIFETEFGLLCILCDGLGGGLSGEFASKVSVEKIHRSFIDSSESDYLKRIRASIESANKFVYEKSNGNLNFKGMATTCEVLLINKTTAYWGHIGDSRIYFFRNGKLSQLTKDHSLIQKLMDDGEISFKEVKNHPKKNVITKAIGDEEIPEIDTSKLLLPAHSKMKFMTCTDGITCVISNDELEKLLENDNIDNISYELSSLVNRRGAPDNFSYIIAAN